MQKITKLAIVLLVVLSGSIGVQDVALAQTPQIAFNLSAGEMATVVIVGVLAGLLHAYQGFRTSTQNFDIQKFTDGVIMCTLASVPLAIGEAVTQTVSGQPLNIFTYVLIFFAALGLGFQIQQTRLKTVPSDATIDPNTNKPIQ